MYKFPTVELECGNARQLLDQIAHQFGVKVEEDCRRSQIVLPKETGKGQLIAYNDLAGMDALIVDIEGELDWTLKLDGTFPEPITFYTSCSGFLSVTNATNSFMVRPLQGTIHGGFTTAKHNIRFQGDEGFVGMLLFVHKKAFFEGMSCETLEIPDKLLAVVEDLERMEPQFLFSDIFHLPVINAVQDILEQRDKGLLNSSFASAKIHEILFLQLNEYKTHTQKSHRRVVRRKERIQLIRDAETILISRLKNPPTIPELARMVGINQQTLKQGFRQLYGSTINQHLNNRRLEQAGVLIRAGELSMREVALEVGYNNPGYFSRKFREKYGVTPRYFGHALEEPGR